MLKSPIGRLRLVALSEAISYLVLLGVAMPLKYMMQIPEPVRYTGMIHGVLFILLCVTLLHALVAKRLSFGFAVVIFIASLIPIVPFFLDKRLKHDEEEEAGA